MADRGDSEPDQILRREIGEDLGVDIVLAERLLVLSQPQITQPRPRRPWAPPGSAVLRGAGALAYLKMAHGGRGETSRADSGGRQLLALSGPSPSPTDTSAGRRRADFAQSGRHRRLLTLKRRRWVDFCLASLRLRVHTGSITAPHRTVL